MSAPIEAVIFDVANVIVHWDPALPLTGRVPAPQIDAFLADEGFWALNAEADAGLRIAQMVPRVAAEMPDLVGTFAVYLAHFPDSVPYPVPGTSAIIEELLERGVPTYGLSNWWSENFSVPRTVAPVIGDLRDVIVSGEVGLAKPDPAIFDLAAARFGVAPATTLFVDDSAANIASAAAQGFATHHFTDAARLRADLTQRGLLG